MQLLLKTQDGKVLRFVSAPIVETHVDSSSPQDEDCRDKVKAVANDCNKNASKIIQSQKLSAAKLVNLLFDFCLKIFLLLKKKLYILILKSVGF